MINPNSQHSDIFTKCFDFNRADEVKASGLYPYFRPLEDNEGPIVRIEGREILMAGSNNYLGLTSHPEVIEASTKATEKYGTGCSGSRYLTGTLDLHIELEQRLAKFLKKESVLLFSTGYQTALGVIPTLVHKGDYVISDKENHACIISAAMMAKGAFAEFKRYRHNDMEDLEAILQKLPIEAGKLIVTDGVFSVSGNYADLEAINRLAKKYNARVLVDDAHAVGVVGKEGRGSLEQFNLIDEIDLQMGTFSKTFASLGGFVAGPERVINYIKHHSPALIFSASPTPASCAAALKSLDILESEPERIANLRKNSDYMRSEFKNLDFQILENESAIVPIIVGNVEHTLQMWKDLFDRGVFVNAFIPPGVPPTMSMLRTSYMATHEKSHLDQILDAFRGIS